MNGFNNRLESTEEKIIGMKTQILQKIMQALSGREKKTQNREKSFRDRLGRIKDLTFV